MAGITEELSFKFKFEKWHWISLLEKNLSMLRIIWVYESAFSTFKFYVIYKLRISHKNLASKLWCSFSTHWISKILYQKKKHEMSLSIFKLITHWNEGIFYIWDQIKYIHITKIYSNDYFLPFVIWLQEKCKCHVHLSLYFYISVQLLRGNLVL